MECIVKDLKLTDEKYDELMENLKDTYIEDNHDGKAIEKIKKNTEEEVKEIIWELYWLLAQHKVY